MNRRLLSFLTICLGMAQVASAQPIAPGKTGEELVEFLRAEFRPDETLSYKNARKKMFGEIDNANGQVRCVYTGQRVTTNGIPDDRVMNTEHTWPQSKFHERPPMKSDLHHLFPTLSKVNGIRSNNPFAEIPDSSTTGWWRSNTKVTQIPDSGEIDQFSESTSHVFEPREDHKGNLARAMFYFWVVYADDGIDPDWITPQLQTLATWHAADAVDAAERERNTHIKAIQGNDNPFILDPTLVARILNQPSLPRALRAPSPLTAVPISPNAPRPVPSRVANRPTLRASENLRLVTWNAKELFRPENAIAREDNLKQLAQEMKPDILFLQEVTSLGVVEAVRDVMDLQGYHVACSDFTQDDSQEFASFEVGIISRFPLDQVIEFDPSPDNEDEADPDESPLPAPLLRLGIPPQETERGYLWARIDQLKMTVAVVHLKSSRGKIGLPDETNAKEREFVIAAVAAGMIEDKALLPDYTYLVAGDFNVGNQDQGKLGRDLMEDCLKRDCDGADRYDETHAILAEGIMGGLRMRNLTLSIPEPTFVGGFPRTGPIDNIYVDGAARDRFSEAVKAATPFGSDHFPVRTELEVEPGDIQPFDGMTRLAPRAAPAVPQADRLRICSFNIQFLGSFKKRDDEALAGLLKDYDIVVVQELIAPPIKGTFPNGDPFKADKEAKEFFDEMEKLGFEYRLSEEDTGTGDTIHSNGTGTEWWVTFYKPDRVKEAPDLPSGFLAEDRSNHDDYERVPYAFGFRSLGDETDFVLISVHLMPGSGEAERRQHELATIATWVSENEGEERDFIILGDMNIEDAEELAAATPEGFLSLNDECRTTNTNVNGPKPYDHVMYRPLLTTEIDQTFDLEVVDLIEEMEAHWTGEDPYPGSPDYDHDTFRQFYSDHHPVVFQITLPPSDDD